MQKSSKQIKLDLHGQKINEYNFGEYLKGVQITKVVRLNLSDNLLESLQIVQGHRTDFIFEGFENLVQLDLSNNPIENINPNSFIYLKSLKRLVVNNLNISKDINFRFLKNLTNLETLEMNGHKIYNLKPASVFNQISKIFPFLVSVDLRPLGMHIKKLSEEDMYTILKFCPSLIKINSKLLSNNDFDKENKKVNAKKPESIVFFNQSFSKLNIRSRQKSKVRHLTKKDNSFDSIDNSSIPKSDQFLKYIDGLTKSKK